MIDFPWLWCEAKHSQNMSDILTVKRRLEKDGGRKRVEIALQSLPSPATYWRMMVATHHTTGRHCSFSFVKGVLFTSRLLFCVDRYLV